MIIFARLAAAVGIATLTAVSVVPRPTAVSAPDDYPVGAALFARHCAACHTLGGGPAMGPDLAGVTLRRSNAWLLRWIDSPPAAVKTDTLAAALVQEWGGWVMPEIDITGAEILDIVDFLTAVDAGEVGEDALASARQPTGPGPCAMMMRAAGATGPGARHMHAAEGHGPGHHARPGAGHACRR